MRTRRIKLGAVGAGQAADIAGVFDHRHLHAQTDAEIGDLVFPRIARRQDHAFDAAVAEAARHQHAVHVRQMTCRAVLLDFFRIDKFQFYPAVVGDAAVHERLIQAFVGIREVDVFARDADADFMGRMIKFFDHILPGGKLRLSGPHVEQFNNLCIESFAVIHQRTLVNAADILGRKDAVDFNIAKQSNLAFNLVGQKVFRPAQQNIRLNADFPQSLHAVLRGFGFHFPGGFNERHPGQMDENGVLPAHFVAELADGFQEGKAFDVAYGSADFHDGNVEPFRGFADEILDLVRDMRDDLNGFAQVVAASFPGNDGKVNLSGCQVVALSHPCGGKSFVVAKIKIRFRAVVGDEDLPVLKRAHRPRININIRIQLLIRHPKPA